MLQNMKGKVAIVTGGSSGIGKACAIEFAKAGVKVVVAARRETESKETIRQIEAVGSEGIFVKTDVTIAAEIERLVNKTLEIYHRLDYAFNNAGFGKIVPLLERSESQWDAETDVNLKAVWLCMKYQIPAMLKTQGGAIVNMASMFAKISIPQVSSYSAAKAGVLGLTKSAALEFAPQGIRINAICPGFIDTDILNNLPKELLEQIVEQIPFKRLGKPEEIANAVVWLCSDGASYMTGQNLLMDGGFSAQ